MSALAGSFLTVDQLTYLFSRACETQADKDAMRRFWKSSEDLIMCLSGVSLHLGVPQQGDTSKAALLADLSTAERIRAALQPMLGVRLPAFPQHMLAVAYAQVQTVAVASQLEYQQALKMVKAYNQKAARRRSYQAAATALDVAVHRAFSYCHVVFVSVDIEWWEQDQDYLLELGWSLWDNQSHQLSSKHWIVTEHLHKSNGRYVPNHRNQYNFGLSLEGNLQHGLATLEADLRSGGLQPPGGAGSVQVILVGHGVKGDIKVLCEHGIDVAAQLEVVETQQLLWAMGKLDDNEQVSMKSMLQQLGLKFSNLHNAGNDARYAMEAFLNILERHCTAGAPV